MRSMGSTKRHRPKVDPDGLFPTKCSRNNKAGDPCGVPPVIGSHLCYRHGGSLPNVRKAADARVAEAANHRALDAMLARMNLDAPPIADPAAAMASLAGRLLSGFEGVQSRLNECREQGRVPNDVDIAERALWVKELRSLLTDMTRLQVGVQLASRYMPDGKAPGAPESAELASEVVGELPDISSIVSAVLQTEAQLEHERLVKVDAAKAQGQLPAGLQVVQGETEQAS